MFVKMDAARCIQAAFGVFAWGRDGDTQKPNSEIDTEKQGRAFHWSILFRGFFLDRRLLFACMYYSSEHG
jgi:hypothetical protein